MITPAFSLDFTSGTLASEVSFSRSGNTATTINSSGNVVIAAENTPRFPCTLGLSSSTKGLLIEETRANLLVNSVFSGAAAGAPGTLPTSWDSPGILITGSITNVTSGYYASGNRLRFTATNQRVFGAQVVSVSTSSTYSISVVVNKISGTVNIIQFITLAAGTPSGGSLSYVLNGNVVSSSTPVPNGLNTIGLLINTGSSTSVTLRLGLGTASNQTGEVDVEMPQFELGAFPTSYIPTTTTALTRNADVATITGTNFSDWWQAGRGGATVAAIPSTVSDTRPLIQFDDGTANEIIALRGNTTNPELYIVDGGSPQAQIDAGTIAVNTAYSLTGWWQTNFCAARKDNGARVIDNSATIPTVTQARLGSDGTNYLNGHLATISYYDQFSGQIYTRRKNKAVFSVL
jgi:hypothetical protein